MKILKYFFGMPAPEPVKPGPYVVTRYWRELDEEKRLAVCRTQEEAALAIRQDQEHFDRQFIKENLYYSVEPVWK